MEIGKPILIKTYVARNKGKILEIRVPGEIWTVELETEQKAETAAKWIKENGIGCSVELIQGLLLEV